MSLGSPSRPAPTGADTVRRVARGPVALRTSTVKLTRSVRLLLAMVALVALFADPAQAVRFPAAAHALLVGYSLMAAALLALSFVPAGHSPRLALGAYILDLVILSALIFVTDASTSPFFLLLTFALLNATLRWRWRGAVISGAVLLCVFLTLALFAGETVAPEQDRLIIRAGYLVSLTLMLAVMGSYQERLSSELSRLAAPQFPPTSDLETALRAILDHAAQVFQARSAIAAWSQDEEPWLHVLTWSKGETSRSTETPDEFEPLVAEALSDKAFFSPAPRSASHLSVFQTGSGYFEWTGEPINARFRERFGLNEALSAPLEAPSIQGRIFVASEKDADPEDLLLLTIIARQAAAHLGQVLASERLREQSAIAERLRIARDLHDGILQFLTGLGLQLESIARGRQNPAELRGRLAEIQDLIRSQQQEVRGFVQTLKPILADRDRVGSGLRARLDELTWRLAQTWNVHIECKIQPPDLELSPRLVDQIAHLVSEAAANAVRHGGAKGVRIDLQREDGTLRLQVADNGSGFPFTGRYNAIDVADGNVLPLMLRERVQGLDGILEIESSPAGATIDVLLPLEER